MQEAGMRKKLLRALRFYSEKQYDAAITALRELEPLCDRSDEHYAVHLFLALCYDNNGLVNAAIEQYELLERMHLADSTVYSNAASLYWKTGQTQKAHTCLQRAVELEPNNEYAHYNRAAFCFYDKEFEQAVLSAKRALEINRKMVQASSLLVIIYSIQGDTAQADTYLHMAVSCGQSRKELKAAIRHYTEE